MLTLFEFGIRSYDAITGEGFFSAPRNPLADVKQPRPFRTFGLTVYEEEAGVRYISSRHDEFYPIQKADNVFRIVVLGGSTTVNMPAYRQADVHYPLLVQEKLRQALNTERIEVINVANAAYATAHSLILFELDALSWNPDLIIISHNVNDLTASYWPDFTYDYANKYGDDYYYPLSNTYTTANVLFQHFELYWWFQERVALLRANGASTSIKRQSYGHDPNPQALKVFERNLHSVVALAQANNIEILLGNQALQQDVEFFERHMAGKAYNRRVTYPLHEEFVSHHQAFNQVIQDVALDTGVYFLDNDSILAGDESYFIDFVHYTPQGVEVLAENYAQFILKHELIKAE